MGAILRIVKQIVAFGDGSPTNHPKLRYVDWNRDISDIPVQNPRSEGHTIAPGAEKVIFDGTRTTFIDGTTAFSVALVPGTSDRYRFRWTGGTNPGFRTDRALDLTGATVSVIINQNQTVNLNITAGTPTFAGVVAGDTLWIPTIDDGVTSPFSPANHGFWTVIAATSASLTLQRPTDCDFEALTETGVVVTAANQVQSFSAAGVQVGDSLDVSLGFAPATLRNFRIVGVTSTYVEVESTVAIPAQTGIVPTALGFLIYTEAKVYLHLEVDQEAIVRANGDTGVTQRVSPWIAADATKPGTYERTGPTWSLRILNRSTRPLHTTLITCE